MIKNKIIGLLILNFLFINCKENENSTDLNNTITSNLAKDSIKQSLNKNIESISNNELVNNNLWIFYKISENTINGSPRETKKEVLNRFKNVKIEIDSKTIDVENLCSFEYYKSEKTSIEYYESDKTAKLYENIFLQNNIKLSKTISVYQSMYPDKTCDMPWDEFLLIDNTLIIVYDDYLLFFKKGEIVDTKAGCYSKTKISQLPLTKELLNKIVWDELDCSIANLATKDYLRLPDVEDVKVFIIGNFNFDDFTYTLVTVKQNKVITKKDIGFAIDGYPENNSRHVTDFEVKKDYTFELTSKEKKKEDWNILKVEKFNIDDNGNLILFK